MKTLIIHTEDDKIQIIKDFLNSIKVKFETKASSNIADTSVSELTKQSPYDPAFVAKIKESEQDYKNGKIHKINLDDIWK
jgi:hypothetical protein